MDSTTSVLSRRGALGGPRPTSANACSIETQGLADVDETHRHGRAGLRSDPGERFLAQELPLGRPPPRIAVAVRLDVAHGPAAMVPGLCNDGPQQDTLRLRLPAAELVEE